MLRSWMIAAPIALWAGVALSDTITLRADVWCPYNCEPDDASTPGYLIEIAKAALEPAGHKVEYASLNWARAIAETRAGAFTGIVGAAKNDAPDFTFPGTELGLSSNCFYVKPDSTWQFKDVPSLSSVAIGVAKDYAYEDQLDEYIKVNAKDPKKIDVVSGDNPLELNLKKVAAGRITAFVEDDSVLSSYFFQKKKAPTVKKAGCIKEAELFIAFGPKTEKREEYAKLLAAKVEAMRKDGSLDTLLKRYGLTDWRKK